MGPGCRQRLGWFWGNGVSREAAACRDGAERGGPGALAPCCWGRFPQRLGKATTAVSFCKVTFKWVAVTQPACALHPGAEPSI